MKSEESILEADKDIAELRANATALREERISAKELFPAEEPDKEPGKSKSAKQERKRESKKISSSNPIIEMAPSPCPDRDNETIMSKEYCDKTCTKNVGEYEGCPVWTDTR